MTFCTSVVCQFDLGYCVKIIIAIDSVVLYFCTTSEVHIDRTHRDVLHVPWFSLISGSVQIFYTFIQQYCAKIGERFGVFDW